ncbi:MAG: DUF1549 domain-containing protein [Planctomycetaceae bacterium]|nr:DUF1549 domain-containing protein [Planctomycetaceae bacterium]MBT6154618.1 DUF1549 domain-containing protein [Planctomycetaceae bacterium]MBT6487228.1 DUF1549 domain-containing protein [Planctomycetaceae bacterium]MBT6495148.1 DUF1549 domain-containing protein [Planctomycetaceae bacterium]
MLIRTGWISLLLAFAWVAMVGDAAAAEPLHTRIDRLVAEKSPVPVGSRSDDPEFLRRISLDLNGRIPSADETREFLADNSPDKRERLIDRLLSSDDYAPRMADLFHVMLMERRGDDPHWRQFLQKSFAENKPWDRMVAEILKPDPDVEHLRGSAFFQTKRLEKYGQNATDYPGLTRDVGRLFLGVDLQCAQCHDHPSVDDYQQVDFQGMYIVFLNSYIRRDTDFPAIGEKLLSKKIEFVSVFVQEQKTTGPRPPFGMEVMIPMLSKEMQFLIPPDRKTRFAGVPRFSPMQVLADTLPTAANVQFKQNAANRLWFAMMGRGIVHPLDLQHSENPPSHPKLLTVLADEFAARNFDIKWMLREFALTETYQRSSLLPADAKEPPPESFAVAFERALSAEQLMDGMLAATGERAVLQNQIDEELREADPKFFDILRANPEMLAGQRNERLAEIRQSFVTAFGNVPRDPEVEFSPTVKASLFLMNEQTVLGWLDRKPGNLVDRLAKMTDYSKLANELYLSVMSRLPSDEERIEVAKFLTKRKDNRDKAIGHLAWALLASTEFRLNH